MKALIFLMVTGLAFLTAAPPRTDGPTVTCVELGGASVWGGGGWNHIVYLSNRCTETVDCVVSTDVTPVAQNVTVPVNANVQVNIAANVPERVFVPNVSCR